MRRTFLLTLFCTVLAAGGALPATALSDPDTQSSRRMAERYARLVAQGADRATVQAVMSKEFGLRFLTESKSVEPQDISFKPDESMVIVDRPQMAFGRDRNFHAFGSMHWRHDCPFTGEEKIACWHHDKGEHGGRDGLAIRVSRPIVKKGGDLFLMDNCGKGTPWDAPAGSADYGVGFMYQDKTYESKAARPEYEASCNEGGSDAGYGFPPTAFNWDTASIHLSFQWQEACRDAIVAIKATYGHSWRRTKLNGISVSESGIGFSWVDEEYKFETESRGDGSYTC